MRVGRGGDGGACERVAVDVVRLDAVCVRKRPGVCFCRHQVGHGRPAAVPAHEQADVLAGMPVEVGAQVAHHHARRCGEAYVVVLVSRGGVARDVEVAQPLRAVRSAHGHEHEGLGLAVLARDALGGERVGHGVGGAARQGGQVVLDGGAVLVGGGLHVVEAQVGQDVGHGLVVGAAVVAGRLGVGEGREHAAGQGELRVVGGGIPEEPLVVPAEVQALCFGRVGGADGADVGVGGNLARGARGRQALLGVERGLGALFAQRGQVHGEDRGG